VTVIVVIGDVMGRRDPAGDIEPAGFSATVALSAARAGATVEVVTRLGDDPHGDAVLLNFAAAGVGHVATLRDPGHDTPLTPDADDPLTSDEPAPDRTMDRGSGAGPRLEAADVTLALRYLTEFGVIVVAHADADIVDEAAAAAGWAGARLVVVTLPDGEAPRDLPVDVLMLAADRDAEGIATLVGHYAAEVDSGADPISAFAALTAATT
jgi:hypothetical protein